MAKKILFLCSQNKRRSLTAERIFQGIDGIEARSAGTETNARVKVTPGLSSLRLNSTYVSLGLIKAAMGLLRISVSFHSPINRNHTLAGRILFLEWRKSISGEFKKSILRSLLQNKLFAYIFPMTMNIWMRL